MLARLLAITATCMVGAACAGRSGPPHPNLTRVWHEYLELREERALAVAGDLRRENWVAGASGGHTTRDEAETEALAACQRRRALRRMQAPCLLYAVGDQIVWEGP